LSNQRIGWCCIDRLSWHGKPDIFVLGPTSPARPHAHAVEITGTLWSDGVRRLMRRTRIMKLLGRWSLASFMKLVIDVPYYFLLVVLPVVFTGALWMVLTGHSAVPTRPEELPPRDISS
jgi:hypothetical protein